MHVVINDKSIGLYLIDSLGLQHSISHYDNILFTKGYPMPFAKNSNYPDLKQIAALFEWALTQLKQDGTYQQLVDRGLKRQQLELAPLKPTRLPVPAR